MKVPKEKDIHEKSSCAVRVSLGLVSNFEDVQAFLKFAEGLLDRASTPDAAGMVQ